MKSIYNMACSLSIVGALASCGDFLDRSAQNLIVPETVTHYQEMLQGQGYFKDLYNNTCWLQLMTDDVEFQECYSRYAKYTSTSGNLLYYADVFTYQQEIENNNFTDEAYLYLYNQVKVANLCLEGANSEVEGTDEEKQILVGQAYFTRAMAYFYLANMYGQAYNEAAPTDLCVPLVLDGKITPESASRATIEQVWNQMKSDINMSLDNLKDKNIISTYAISYKAALALATRISLYMEDYDKAIAYGEELIQLQPELMDITNETMAAPKNTYYSSDGVLNFLGSSNPEIIWNFNTTPSLGSSGYTYYSLAGPYGGGYLGYWIAPSSQSTFTTVEQKNLIDMYDADATAKTGDRRLLYWFIQPSKKTSSSYTSSYNTYRVLKYDKDDKDTKMLMQCFRTAEIYVSLAEAYARRNGAGDADKAISYLNILREKRISPYTALTAADFATNDALVQFCWDERRRELCFEECHRWFDMRREGQKAITHRYNEGGTSGNKFESYSLKEKDAAFILNFPQAERLLSPNMETNARPQRTQD